jgi:uncharacterized SAM-binding protein YcdF (DUF218 family)
MTTFAILALAVSILAGRRVRGARTVTAAAACVLFLWTWPPFGWLFSGTLEWWYPVRPLPSGDAGAIVILSSNLYPHDRSQPEPLPGFSTYLRCRRGAWLFHHWKRLPVVVTGGAVSAGEPATLADVMAAELANAGVPAADIQLEKKSANTYESAARCAGVLRAQGIRRVALVTEAFHMLRAERAFRRQGLEVVPAPCAYRTTRFRPVWNNFLPRPGEASENDANLHEWLGLVWYAVSRKG